MELLLIFVGIPVLVLMLWLVFSETAPYDAPPPEEDQNTIAGGGVSSLAQMSSFLGM